jgi:hypothetical protein
MGRLERKLGLELRTLLIHYCDILWRIWSLELMELKRLMGVKMEDSLRLRQDRTLMGRYLDHSLVQEQCPIHMFHQFYFVQLDILIGEELELKLIMEVAQLELMVHMLMVMVMEMEKNHSSSIRNSCRLHMQLLLRLWL